MDGGEGNDRLSGGAGSDLYLHDRHGGNDVIDEGGIAQQVDVLRFGAGIGQHMVTVKRHHGDLVLDLRGPHGSVTIKGWFASSARRVERIEFADGTSWDEAQIRARAGGRHDDDAHHGHDQHHDHDRDDERDRGRKHRDADDERHDDRRDRDHDRAVDAIAARLSRSHRFDFESLLRELERPGARLHDAREIAQRWRAAGAFAHALDAGDGARESAWSMRRGLLSGAAAQGGTHWGFEGSTGAARGQDGLRTLEGLNEGFGKL
ncbi:MAG: calcium-binding protein [Burkholderiales bacterium]